MTLKSGDKVRIKNHPEKGILTILMASEGLKRVITEEPIGVYDIKDLILLPKCKLNRNKEKR